MGVQKVGNGSAATGGDIRTYNSRRHLDDKSLAVPEMKH